MSNLTNQFIPYEQALKLKELGFDEECFAIYSPKKELLIEDEWLYSTNSQTMSSCKNPTAPLWQQVFDWFREKYNLHVYVHHFIEQPVDNEIWKNCYQFFINDEAFHPYCRTYEEAREECLNHLIKTIKNETIN